MSRQRVSRKLKKAINSVVISYDVESLPTDYGVNSDKMLYIFQHTGIIFYTSYKGGNPPQIFPKTKRIKIRDYAGQRK